jgi:hypothetical protein
MFCGSCWAKLSEEFKFCTKFGLCVALLLRHRAKIAEMRKELIKCTQKAEKLRKADPSASYHFHHAVQNALNSLTETKKPINSVEDLSGLKGFGPHVTSLARTCTFRKYAADPDLGPRPKRPRVKGLARSYTPRIGSQAFALLCIARRHDGVTMDHFARFNDEYGYSNSPFVQGSKGWSANPMHQLCEKGLLVGGFESGWTLTDSGEEVADRALRKWDQSIEMSDGEDEGDDDVPMGKEEKVEAKTKPQSRTKKNSRKRSDSDDFFGEIEMMEEDFKSPVAKKPTPSSSASAATPSRALGLSSPANGAGSGSSSAAVAGIAAASVLSSLSLSPVPASPSPAPAPSASVARAAAEDTERVK